LATVERAAVDPFPERVVVTQSTSDTKPEVSGIGVDEAWANAAIASVAVNQCQLCFGHLPYLLHEFMEPSASDDLGGMESVKVYFHARSPDSLSVKHSPRYSNEQYGQPNLLASAAPTVSNVFQTNLVVDRFPQPLLATQVTLSRLYADMSEQKLDLFQFAA
jgi:hypothetical protein